MGGIGSFEDAMEFLLVGASAIQIGTMNFVYPDISQRVAEAMEAWFSAPGAPLLRDYVGSLLV
jgi:dihydroorotate dehydrogenase (NAD+) catalytic subunit